MSLMRTLLSFALAVASIPAVAGSSFTVLHNFGASDDGRFPSGPPAMDAGGNLYGVTSAGGTGMCGGYGCGTVYELTPSKTGWSETILHKFEDQGDGADPVSDVVIDTAGNLYGTLAGAGPGQTAVFELQPDPGGWSLSLLYSGASPGLLLGKAGALYGYFGAGEHEAGAIAELSPGPGEWNYDLLYSFGGDGGKNGWEPLAPLSWDAKGNLYGTTYWGGGIGLPNCIQGFGCGVAFELTYNPVAFSTQGLWAYHVIHRFASTATDGQNPNGGLTLDAQGNAYGTTPVGGAACLPVGCGTVFKLTPVGGAPGFWVETTLYDFPATPNCSQGCSPGSNMLFDRAGNLYGVAGGGSNSCAGTCGVVFKLTPGPDGQWSYSIVHEFAGSDGANPLGLAMDANGNLFGTTQTGGTYNLGVVYEITR